MTKYLLFIVATFIVSSCSSPDEVAAPKETHSTEVLSYIRSLGIPDKEIKELPDKFIVQEDIMFPKTMGFPRSSRQGRSDQSYYSLISFVNQRPIRIMIDPSMTASPDMSSEIRSAIRIWNNVQYYGSQIIKNTNLGSGVCGRGTFPSGGLAGSLIEINKSYISGNSLDQRIRTIAHEIGHNIGFFHTNQSGGINVPGYPGTDAASLMNAGQCGSGATVLSSRDVNATVVLYPSNRAYHIWHNGTYPFTFSWTEPLYTGSGPVVGYEVKHVRTDWYGNPTTSTVTFQTSRQHTLPYVQYQYSGQWVLLYVRAQFADGTLSDWNSHNCTL
jgi:hypothetical protein